MNKTRKSVTKRMRVTKGGKITRRKMGLGHFRSKKSSREMHRKEPGSGTSMSKVDGKKFIKSYGIRF